MVQPLFTPPASLTDHSAVGTAGDGAVEVTATGGGVLTHVDIQPIESVSSGRLSAWLTTAITAALDDAAATTMQRVMDSPDVPETLKALVRTPDTSLLVSRAKLPEGPVAVTCGQITATVTPERRIGSVHVEGRIADISVMETDVVNAVNGAFVASMPGLDPSDLERAVDERIADLDQTFERLNGRLSTLDDRLDKLDQHL